MAEWTKGLGLLVHNEARCAGGCGFDPQPGQYTRRVYHPTRLPGKVFSMNVLKFQILNLFRIVVPVGSIKLQTICISLTAVASHVKKTFHFGNYYYYNEFHRLSLNTIKVMGRHMLGFI